MKTISVAAALSMLAFALPLPVVATSAFAASAHNSQAGGAPGGSTTDSAKPTGKMMMKKTKMKHMKKM